MKFLILIFLIFLITTPQVVDALDSNDLGLQYGAPTGLGTAGVRTTVARIIRVVLGLLGIVTVVGVVAGGFMYMTAGGNEQKTSGGMKVTAGEVIGLIIILRAYAITGFVISNLVAATTQ